MKTPMEHVLRSPLPWRADEEAKTECGKLAIDVAKSITFDDLVRKVKDQGQQRAAMSTCMTCMGRADFRRLQDWDSCPGSLLYRESQHEPGHAWNPVHEDSLLDRELRAIAALVEAHRDEFDGYINGLQSTVSLAERRRAKAVRRG